MHKAPNLQQSPHSLLPSPRSSLIYITITCNNIIQSREMHHPSILNILLHSLLLLLFGRPSTSTPTIPSSHHSRFPPTTTLLEPNSKGRNISIPLFISLEEFSRIVDISYCVGTTGIQKPFVCASRCEEFPSFELVREFNTGPLMSDSCGYIALDHGVGSRNDVGEEVERKGRIIIAFRGTYSIANTIVDLSTVPQEYVPYPRNSANETSPAHGGEDGKGWRKWLPDYFHHHLSQTPTISASSSSTNGKEKEKIKCNNCTVHSGFWQSWQNTRSIILPDLEIARSQYPDYEVHLVGHSLGGAVAALAGLELDALGWEPTITTFGEPKIGNAGLREFIDARFGLRSSNSNVEARGGEVGGKDDKMGGIYRRVTHVDDPVPLLPLQEWGYRPHAGELYISKSSLQPSLLDLSFCSGDEDPECISGSESPSSWMNSAIADMLQHATSSIGLNQDVLMKQDKDEGEEELELRKRWGIPIGSRYKMWQLFFAHRDYFWRLGLCVKGGDPSDWGRDKYHFPGEREMPQ
jgi:hypothetical protein